MAPSASDASRIASPTGAGRRAATPVLLVSHHAGIVGGGEISLFALLEGLDRSRWAPVLAVPADGPVAAGARARGVPAHVVPMPTLRRPGVGVARGLAALRGLARRTGAGVLHANGSRAMFYAGLAGWLCRRPVVWHLRVADRDALLDRLLLGLSSAVIANSSAVAGRLAGAPPGKVRCIPNGVDVARFAPRPPAPGLRGALGVPDGAPLVASVGRFVGFKGYADLLSAAARVRERRPDVHWLLVGDGELRGELEAQARALGLDGAVHFTGWRDDVPEILTLADVFALPSLGEHFGRVLIEAMAVAKPVVATDGGGVPDVVVHAETGLLVPPGDPGALADALLAVLADPARAARLGTAGRQRVERLFSLRRHAEEVERLYGELAGAAHDAHTSDG